MDILTGIMITVIGAICTWIMVFIVIGMVRRAIHKKGPIANFVGFIVDLFFKLAEWAFDDIDD